MGEELGASEVITDKPKRRLSPQERGAKAIADAKKWSAANEERSKARRKENDARFAKLKKQLAADQKSRSERFTELRRQEQEHRAKSEAKRARRAG